MVTKQDINKIDDKLDKISDKIEGVKETLAYQGGVLTEHQRRSLALEKEVSLLQKHFNRVLGAFVLLQIAIPVILKYIV